jgi:hypothetical protein
MTLYHGMTLADYAAVGVLVAASRSGARCCYWRGANADNDKAAIEQSKNMLDGVRAEPWLSGQGDGFGDGRIPRTTAE